ncbi:uncharacterized protein LOC115266099 [Aedes albopictus]|uniref:CHK kinase-like domain-containing protein n=1 Tax=Aedes albopictus TaxID=7160 RepID=A0ABM1XRX5_AEDAL
MSESVYSEITSWRNANYFENVVATDYKIKTSEFNIAKIHISTAIPKHSGAVSLVHRVLLQVHFHGRSSPKHVSYIVKERADSDEDHELAGNSCTFAKEIELYTQILPGFEKLWANENVKFGPRVLKVTITPFRLIVMEDLKASGFRTKKSLRGFKTSDCEKVLEKLAKFHAASVQYIERKGSFSDQFKTGTLNDKTMKAYEVYYTPLFDSFYQMLDDLKYHPKILEKLLPLKGKAYATTCNLFRLNPTKFNVLNHGDLRMTNIHIREFDKLLLNYQTSFYGSPAFDLIYFLTMSASFCTRIDRFDHLIDHYYKHLKAGLQKLGVMTAIPTQRQLREDLAAHGFLMCLKSIEALAVTLEMPKLELDMKLFRSTGPDGAEFRRNLYANVQFEKTLERLVMFMWKRGFFNFSQM